jgi:arsenate reductase
MPKCDYCGKEFYAGDGAWDDGDYTCGECLADQIEESERKKSDVGRHLLSILFVCQGNTCRSVMAAAFAKRLFDDRVQVASAGLSPQTQNDAQAAVECLKSDFQIDAGPHEPRRITQADVDAANIVVAMDKTVGSQLKFVPSTKLMIWKIEDPWRGDDLEYRRCGLAIKKALGSLASRVRNELGAK